ncbi:hypothetical protein [Okeania sp. SIO2B3]|uniref:hypothetical protein n=1 Tax=Okeania sp. SIO2B3 TaxID=2607784 RepID=UPI0013C04B4F|nr:hypothetical protein [Okeania sp. SIO2B3]NET47008.1 hypothetical protein [Okeania sp. SIO2B3]
MVNIEEAIEEILKNKDKTATQLLNEYRSKFNLNEKRYQELLVIATTESIMTSLLQEVIALKLYDRDHYYDRARILFYSGLLEEDNIKIKEAGKILYENEGMEGMYDNLLWSFVPKSWHRYVDILWNGIGQWRS